MPGSNLAGLPTRSQIEAWDTSHLTSAARSWSATADQWEASFSTIHQGALAPGGSGWDGATAAATARRTQSDKLTVIGIADDLCAAASTATVGAREISAAKNVVLDAIRRAEDAGLDVGEDLSLSSREEFPPGPEYDAKLAQAKQLAAEIRSAAAALLNSDQAAAGALTAAVAAFESVSFAEVPGAPQDRDGSVQLVDNRTFKEGPMMSPTPEPGAGGGGDGTPTLEDMLLPTEREQPAPGASPPQAAVIPPQQPPQSAVPKLQPPAGTDPKALEEGKAAIRSLLAAQGVPSDQIEQRINDMVASSEQFWATYDPNAPLPAPPKLPPQPAPGFVDGFRDRWLATEQSFKNLFGTGGPKAPGVFESWRDLVTGTAEEIGRTAANPLHPLLSEVQNAMDAPSLAYYAGEKGADGAMTAPALLFGPEAGLLRSGALHGLDLPEMDTPAPHVPDGPTPGHGPTSAHLTPFEIADPIDTSRPEFGLDNPTQYMPPGLRVLTEQHLSGSGETVLGPFAPRDGGPSYIDVARDRGASYFDLGADWYSYAPQQQLAANQHVLDMAIANHDTITLSVPFYKVLPDTYTGAELRYLLDHGYQLVGDTKLVPPKIEGGS
ncbi:hypothetical protein [Mycolicibacterium confluentis]|uniref:Uncharacterized protein n=1 Tax=Mycolicibacterium confluentis TaxID=28047 RepID=A0A7I7XT23_9MYCO|nr:hypothetical protein [Mycolicibacterium confluentis]MCV7321124.1 hypothetical protein [Mycolicibacterium confluentis]ORV21279.1 hypothetical protein AWB99_27130 [Mycolicibacterium confluentis]BBZ32400.1 hypothetical protein MCNF_10050 [Mycolicibacterium confluentis]